MEPPAGAVTPSLRPTLEYASPFPHKGRFEEGYSTREPFNVLVMRGGELRINHPALRDAAKCFLDLDGCIGFGNVSLMHGTAISSFHRAYLKSVITS